MAKTKQVQETPAPVELWPNLSYNAWQSIYVRVRRLARRYGLAPGSPMRKTRQSPSRFNVPLPENSDVTYVHTIEFSVDELKNLVQICKAEFGKDETVTRVLQGALARIQAAHEAGKLPPGNRWSQEIHLTKDEIQGLYTRMERRFIRGA